MTIQCCVCHKVKVQDEWIRCHEDHLGGISHTYCPVCLEECVSSMHVERRMADRAVLSAV